MKLLKILSAACLMILFVQEGHAQEKSWIGKWQYSAPQADYPYQNGKIIFSMEGEELKAFVEVNGRKLQARELEVSENKASFVLTIEGESVKVFLTSKGKELTGTATYSGGEVTLSGKKSV